jgi:hypothetical protein
VVSVVSFNLPAPPTSGVRKSTGNNFGAVTSACFENLRRGLLFLNAEEFC